VVPEEALIDVLRELQLNVSEQQVVTWVEFKRCASWVVARLSHAP
jgi:hypothetical protein